MSKKRKPLLPLLALTALLSVGALNRQTLFSTSPPEPKTIFAATVMGGTWKSSDRSAEQILAAFQSRYGPHQIVWLRLNVWQRMNLGSLAFESNSRIVLGPTRCARLSMKLNGGNGNMWVDVISDGQTLAKAVKTPDGTPTVTTAILAERSGQAGGADPLTSEGCCGPGTFIDRLLTHTKSFVVQEQKGMIRLQAETKSELMAFSLPPGLRLRCSLYFDEASFWLKRVEWSLLESGREQTFLEMEYRDPVINQPLTDEECHQEFSFAH